MNLTELLRRGPSLSTLSDEDLGALAAAFEVASYPDGHVFVRAGEHSKGIYLVIEGEVEVCAAGLRAINRLRPGSLFGLLTLVDQEPRAATCSAVGDCRVGVLTGEAVSSLLNRSGSVACAFQRAVAVQLAKDFRHLDRRLREACQPPPSTTRSGG